MNLKKLKFSKKAESTTFYIVMVFRMFLIGASLILFVFFLNSISTVEYDTTKIESQVLTMGFIYSPASFIYSDNNLAHPGTIDYEKFNGERISNDFIYNKGKYGAKLVLTDDDENVIKTIYFNKFLYDDAKAYVNVNKRYHSYKSSIYVMIENNPEVKSGVLNVEMIVVEPK